MSLRVRLSILVAVAVAPTLALTAYNSYTWRKFLQEEANQEALGSARLVSAELTQLLKGTQRVMLTLMKYPAVPFREAECTAFFKSVIANLEVYREAAFIDRGGKFHCSTVPIPPTLDVHDRVYFREPLATGLFTVGTLTTGRVTGQSSIHVSLPYRDANNHIDGIIVLILNPRKIEQDFASRPWPANHRVTVFDRNGSVVLNIHGEGDKDAAFRSKLLFERARDAPAGTFTAETRPGHEEIVGYIPLKGEPEGFVVTVGIDSDVALAQISNTFWRSAVIGLLAIILAILGVWLATHALIRRPVMKMVETARQREAGNIAAHFPSLSTSSELGLLSSALASMSDKVDRLLEQKEFLLRELQHRVMNSLNILSSLLMLQGKHSKQPAVREQLARAQERVLAMGTVYRHLYSIDTAGKVDFAELLKMICRESERAYIGTSRPRIACEVGPLEVSGNQATSLAVLAHELITNALKHAYPEGEAGPISVRLRRDADGSAELRVADRGRGMPSDVDADQTQSLGFKVIMATVRQFGGTLTINRLDPGTEFLIRFPPNFSAGDGDKETTAA
jgi:two-component sensor histidine kinase